MPRALSFSFRLTRINKYSNGINNKKEYAKLNYNMQIQFLTLLCAVSYRSLLLFMLYGSGVTGMCSTHRQWTRIISYSVLPVLG